MNAAASLPRTRHCARGATHNPIAVPGINPVHAGRRTGLQVVRPAGRSTWTPALLPACRKPGPETPQKRAHQPLDPGPLLQGCKTVGSAYDGSNPSPATTWKVQLRDAPASLTHVQPRQPDATRSRRMPLVVGYTWDDSRQCGLVAGSHRCHPVSFGFCHCLHKSGRLARQGSALVPTPR